MATKKYYIIKRGRTNGIVDSWALCKESTERFPGAKYWGFSTEFDLFVAIRSINWSFISKPIIVINNKRYPITNVDNAIEIICQNSPKDLKEAVVESANYKNLVVS